MASTAYEKGKEMAPSTEQIKDAASKAADTAKDLSSKALDKGKDLVEQAKQTDLYQHPIDKTKELA